jgi:hypothetical protein
MTKFHCDELIEVALDGRRVEEVLPAYEKFDVDEEEIAHEFMCMVCWYLVEEPVKCDQCKKKLFCAGCVARLKSCPNCRAASLEKEELSEEEKR